jgi:hypothetical protein
MVKGRNAWLINERASRGDKLKKKIRDLFPSETNGALNSI